ncbi:MAG: hypothetical protein ACI4XB_09245 [Ruminococcus sp.]
MNRKHRSILSCICLSLLLLSLLTVCSGCSAEKQTHSAVPYIKNQWETTVLEKISHELSLSDLAEASEICHVQAASLLEQDAGLHWYPQYQSAVVIAVDREQTDAVIKGWEDLKQAEGSVSLIQNSMPDLALVLAAVTYGTDHGDLSSLDGATKYLSYFQQENRFTPEDPDAPFFICLEQRAIELQQSGKALEIIIPEEGTLAYSYGLLSTDSLEIPEKLPQKLTATGLCLDMQNDPRYASVKLIESPEDIAAIQKSIEEACSTYRRQILHIRLYSSSDDFELYLITAGFLLMVVFWIGTAMHRILQRRIRFGAYLSALLMSGWLLVRLIKYQIPSECIANRYFWYLYYLFFLSIPLLMLWLAQTIDRTDMKKQPPKWFIASCIWVGCLFLLVMTNDLHMLVFSLDLSKPDWNHNYGYGIGYYLIYATIFLMVFTALGMLAVKSFRSGKRSAAVFPLLLCLLLFLYGTGYVLRVPIAWESDIVLTVDILFLLFWESATATGLIPVNRKYRLLFSTSTLKIQITDKTNICRFAAANRLPDTVLQRAAESPIQPFVLDEDTLLHHKHITGGTVFWQENIRRIRELKQNISEMNRSLTAANVLLAEQQQIQMKLAATEEQNRALEQLENEVHEKKQLLSRLIKQFPEAEDPVHEASKIALLLCFIKRRCGFFFQEQEESTAALARVQFYLEELSEIADLSNVSAVILCQGESHIPAHQAILCYDLLFEVLFLGTSLSQAHLIAQIRTAPEQNEMQILPSFPLSEHSLSEQLRQAVSSENGTLIVRQLDDDITGITLHFGEEAKTC